MHKNLNGILTALIQQKDPIPAGSMSLNLHLLMDKDCSQDPPKSRVFKLHKGRTTVIGRDSKSDVQLVDSNVSRAHAKVDVNEAGGAMVSDLSSANGTKVNGKVIKPHAALQAGDIVEFGKSCVATVGEVDDVKRLIDYMDKRERQKKRRSSKEGKDAVFADMSPGTVGRTLGIDKIM